MAAAYTAPSPGAEALISQYQAAHPGVSREAAIAALNNEKGANGVSSLGEARIADYIAAHPEASREQAITGLRGGGGDASSNPIVAIGEKAIDVAGLGNTDTSALDASRKQLEAAGADIHSRLQNGDNFTPTTVAYRNVLAPVVNDVQAQEIRARQVSNLGSLERAAAGETPSPAEIALMRQQAAIASQQRGMAAGVGGNAGTFARREAARNIQAGQGQAALNAEQLRAQEMATARQSLAGAYASARGDDAAMATERARLGLAADTTTAGLHQGADLANQGAGLSARGQTIGREGMLTNAYLQALNGSANLNMQKMQIAQQDKARRTGAITTGLSYGLVNYPGGGGASPYGAPQPAYGQPAFGEPVDPWAR